MGITSAVCAFWNNGCPLWCFNLLLPPDVIVEGEHRFDAINLLHYSSGNDSRLDDLSYEFSRVTVNSTDQAIPLLGEQVDEGNDQ